MAGSQGEPNGVGFEDKLEQLRRKREEEERARLEEERQRRLEHERAQRERALSGQREQKAMISLARDELMPLIEAVNRVYLRGNGSVIMKPGALQLRYAELRNRRVPSILIMLIWGTRTDHEVGVVNGYKIVFKLESSREVRIERQTVDLTPDNWRQTVQETIYEILADPKACFIQQPLDSK